jgi:hypothetical protein
MNGNITREGITADLEAMARVGIGGAQIFNAGENIPHGPVEFNSPEWLGLVKHAAQESRRLGIELCIHNCAGWSSSGGPWNTPEHGMKMVVTRETRVQGPAAFKGSVEQPRDNLGFYRDIAVLAFRTPAGEKFTLRDAAPEVTLSGPFKQDAGKVADGDRATNVRLPLPKPGAPQHVQFAFAQPFKARLLSLTPGPGMQGCSGRIECSDDGVTFKTAGTFSMPRGSELQVYTFAPVSAKFFRVLFTGANVKTKTLSLAEIEFSSRVGIENLAGKIFLDRTDIRGGAHAETIPEETVQSRDIVDLTDRMAKDGTLSWDVPEGEWTVVRFGYTANGRKNHPAPAEGTGLECDKLSREAVRAHWDGHMGKLLAELGPLAGRGDTGLNNVLIDSYEVGAQNWTQGFEQAFKKRRGYELTRYLPALTGRVVDSPEVTERFLWDFRRTVADMFSENYSGMFAELAHASGLLYSVEPYGNCPSDDLQYGRFCDIPMGEFWPGSGENVGTGNAKMPASIAHVWGKKFVGAEAFTASPEAGRWLKDPYAIKAQGDAVYCGGVNRMIYHRYAHQPWTAPARLPGMTMGQWGTHFERTLTWWEQSKDWLAYQARCQYLLQEGRFVADVCFYCGEGAPNGLRGGGLPQGYDYDGCDTDALMLMTVKDGRVTLPSGMSYRLLALPNDTTMSPAVLRKIGELVEAGATVVGPKPARAPGLGGYPACDAEVKRLADAVWGKGVAAQSPAEALAALNVKPDFTCADSTARLNAIHRVAQGADIYFVACPKTRGAEAECTFRVSGKRPELWHPDTGAREYAPVYSEREGLTTVPLRFGPAGSVFVVFREPAEGDHAVAFRRVVEETVRKPHGELVILRAEYGAFGEVAETDCIDVTDVVRRSVEQGNRRIRAGNDLAGDPASMVEKELKIDYRLDGAAKSVTVAENKTVEVPEGAEIVRAVYGLLGDAPPPQPQVVDVTAQLAGKVSAGMLAVQVDNALSGKDPAPNIVKEVRVAYSYNGQRKQVRVGENQVLTLPQESEAALPVPAYEVAAGARGGIEVQAWEPGRFEVTLASGKTLRAEVAAVPAAFELAGAWEVGFPQGWGAPPRVTFDRLVSWTQREETDVKYFSGTATYEKRFTWDGEKRADERYVLDFGDLKNFAETELNGKPLSLLWKPPYRLDVTEALQRGENTLKVKVTNLWPNRLIGDEQLPEDREWTVKHLKAWPQWVLDGKPSPTGRFTFTTWRHWYKDDEPLPSGIFGPVRVRTVKTALCR